jgi:hypothetical protein
VIKNLLGWQAQLPSLAADDQDFGIFFRQKVGEVLSEFP